MNSKWLGIALIVSVVVNLVLAGFVVGRITQGVIPGKGEVSYDITRAYPRFAKELPDHRKDDLKPYIRGHLKSLRGNRQALRDARHNVNRAITTSPFNQKGLEQALAKMNEVQHTYTTTAQKSFVHFIASLDDLERQQFVERNRRFISRRDQKKRIE